MEIKWKDHGPELKLGSSSNNQSCAMEFKTKKGSESLHFIAFHVLANLISRTQVWCLP